MADDAIVASSLYENKVGVGTEEISQEDLNTPILKIIQTNTQNIENKQEGFFYRSDTREQVESVDVNLVYVSTLEVENYNKTGKEKVKVYFGFYGGTNEPFKMYIRGWGLASHRNFQTEVAGVKTKLGVPMLALTVHLTTEKQSGTIADTGKPYTVYKPIFTVLKDDQGLIIEKTPERVNFLLEAVARFRAISFTSQTDDKQNAVEAVEEPPPF